MGGIFAIFSVLFRFFRFLVPSQKSPERRESELEKKKKKELIFRIRLGILIHDSEHFGSGSSFI